MDSWTIFEIDYAISLCYRSEAILEGLEYIGRAHIYRDYMKFVACSKICHSNFSHVEDQP